MSKQDNPHEVAPVATEPLPAAAEEETQPEGTDTPPPETLGRAYDLLQQLLAQNEGQVSSIQLKRALVSQLDIPEPLASQCIRALQFLDGDALARMGKPDAKVFHRGRSFVSKDKLDESLEKTAKEAEAKEQEAEDAPEEQPEKQTAQNRQEEARLGAYVKAGLENIYDSDHASDDTPYVFDVHNDRPGSAFENVDLLAVHWRSDQTVDLVSIEVKLEFSAKAVHQACSYTRFSHRVWVACAVSSEAPEAALELRSADPGLFDYAIARGIGILACRRSQGRSYQVFPVHWPAWQNPEPVEKERFVDRYRDVFIEAGVIETKKRTAKY